MAQARPSADCCESSETPEESARQLDGRAIDPALQRLGMSVEVAEFGLQRRHPIGEHLDAGFAAECRVAQAEDLATELLRVVVEGVAPRR